MPYIGVHDKEKNGDNWCIHKRKPNGEPGDLVGCSASEADMNKYMAKLHMVEQGRATPEDLAELSALGWIGATREDPLIYWTAHFPDEADKTLDRRVRAIEVDETTGHLTGYLALWGSPTQTDCYRTWFDKNRPPRLGLEYLPVPLQYAHGGDKEIGYLPIGVVTRAWPDSQGIRFEGQLYQDGPYYDRVVKEIRAGLLSTSSGSSSHLADFDNEGRFVNWPLAELSLTSKPCEKRMPKVTVRSAEADPLQNKEAVLSLGGINSSSTVHPSPIRGGPARVGDGNTEAGDQLQMFIQSLNTGGVPMLRSLADLGLAPDVDPMTVLTALIQEYGADKVMAAIQQAMGQGGNNPAETSAVPAVPVAPALSTEAVPAVTPTPVPQPVAQPAPAAVTPTPAPAVEQRAHLTPAELSAVVMRLIGQPVRQEPAPAPSMEALQAQINQLRLAQMSAPAQTTPVPTRTDRNQAPAVLEIDRRFDNLSLREMVSGAVWIQAMVDAGVPETRSISDGYKRALACRAEAEQGKDEAAIRALDPLRRKYGRAVRSAEIEMSTLTTYGDEWVGTYYGTDLWLTVRQATVYQALVKKGMVEKEIPKGAESYRFPIEGTDPTFYVVGQTADEDGHGHPLTKLDSSKPSTVKQDLTVKKLGSAVEFNGELDEDSLINELPEQRRKQDIAFQEKLDYCVICGDTEAGASTNINLIDGTPTAATLGSLPGYMLLDGFLKLALVTNTANSRDGGALDESDFLETLKLMGTGGKYTIARGKVLFLVDNWVYHKALDLAVVKTEDKFSAATINNGEITKLWGVDLMASEWMALANTAGKISATPGNNLYGRLLAVRPDQWAFGYKRRATTEVTRFPRADVTEIVTYARLGMIYRDTEASAVTYDLTV